jgi:hypothetical protein
MKALSRLAAAQGIAAMQSYVSRRHASLQDGSVRNSARLRGIGGLFTPPMVEARLRLSAFWLPKLSPGRDAGNRLVQCASKRTPGACRSMHRRQRDFWGNYLNRWTAGITVGGRYPRRNGPANRRPLSPGMQDGGGAG